MQTADQLSYWVDPWLAQMFPSSPTSPGPDILQLSVSETSSVEILATKDGDGSVVLMIVDHAVHAPTHLLDVLFSFRVYLDEKVHAPQRDLLILTVCC